MTRFLMLLCVWLTLHSACETTAQTSRKTSSNAAAFELLESSIHRYLPGRQEAAITHEYTISGIWKSSSPPSSFYWRGENGEWQTCRVVPFPGKGKAHAQLQGDLPFDDIKKDQQITVIPVAGGKYPIPEFVKEEEINTLYYQTHDSKWHQQPITSFTFRKQTAMP